MNSGDVDQSDKIFRLRAKLEEINAISGSTTEKIRRLKEIIKVLTSLRGVIADEELDRQLSTHYDRLLSAINDLSNVDSVGEKVDSPNMLQAREINGAIGERGVNAGDVGGDLITGDYVIVVKEGGTLAIGRKESEVMDAVDPKSPLGQYLDHIIAHNRYLQLQGIRSGGRLVHIELDHIYVSLRTTKQHIVSSEEYWLKQEAALAPGERSRLEQGRKITEVSTISVDETMASHRRLVVLGDPGCGKTTLLRYISLVYAREMARDDGSVREHLGLNEAAMLPILLPLRQLGAFLKNNSDESTEGHRSILDLLHNQLRNERISVPLGFFDLYLQSGHAIVLLDGLDEVADPNLRRRVARLVEAFTRKYPDCRYIVTSRIVGYIGAARLGEGFAISTVRDFTLNDVEQFLSRWHQLVAIGQMGPGVSADTYSANQTRQLMDAIRDNERIQDLAINPLMLTVIALVHRDRAKLPDRRAELYAEAVDVLLGNWDEAKGLPVAEIILPGRPFDTGDRRLLLQSIALHMHETTKKDIEVGELTELLAKLFRDTGANRAEINRGVRQFLHGIEERTGLLTARGEGVFSFSHLTFQEYLAALAIAGRDDYVSYTLARSPNSWWREVILLEAGYLSTLSKEKTTTLIKAIAESRQKSASHYSLVLAAECLRDVGAGRVQGDLYNVINNRLRSVYQARPTGWIRVKYALTRQARYLIEPRIVAATSLAAVGGQPFWKLPYGEPEWVEISAGKFTMGSGPNEPLGIFDEIPQHQLDLPIYWIARVPITNAQYELFLRANGYEIPDYWEDGRVPPGLESLPVVDITWNDAMAYSQWLAQSTGKSVTLPSEAEWEKAARGMVGAQYFPWGDSYVPSFCNGEELALGTATPVGIFPEGASPYGVLDMSGNVFEWTRSCRENYPYIPSDGREIFESTNKKRIMIIRGGSFFGNKLWQRCAARYGRDSDSRVNDLGFRVVVSPISPTSGL